MLCQGTCSGVRKNSPACDELIDQKKIQIGGLSVRHNSREEKGAGMPPKITKKRICKYKPGPAGRIRKNPYDSCPYA
jgi:hypothetical protein